MSLKLVDFVSHKGEKLFLIFDVTDEQGNVHRVQWDTKEVEQLKDRGFHGKFHFEFIPTQGA